MAETNLVEQINEDLKKAMREHDETAKLVLRSVKTAITEAQKSGAEQRELTPEEVLRVITKQAKQRRDAIAEYEKAGRMDLADKEKAELKILEHYLPKQLTQAELEQIVQLVIAEVGATSLRDMGKVMSTVMSRVAGKADGKVVSQIVRRMLS
jgi:hypothetical protein